MADWDEIYAEIAAGSVDLLLVSPERLNNPGFRDLVLPKLAATAGMLVVDEAHCISDWGHDFRPDYRRLRTVLENLPPGVPVLATTATANARVTRDVAEQLASGADGEALVLRGPLDRESLCLAVVELPTAQQRLGWLAEHLDQLPGSGIIYTLTVAAAHETAAFLRDRGHEVLPYTGRDEQEQRLAAERALLGGELKALVATSALGMGFDKPDLGFVVHLGAPQSPVAYYQQIGRAGRAVPRAEVVLLPGLEDRDIWAYFASLAFPPEPLVRATLGALGEAARAAVVRCAGDPDRPEPGPAGDDAQGPGRGRRRAQGQRRLDRHRAALGLRRRALRPGGGRTPPRAAGHAQLPAHPGLPDGVPAPAAGRPRGPAVRPVRQLHRAPVARGGLGGRGRAGPGPAAPSGHRHQPAPDVATGHEAARRGRGGQDPGGVVGGHRPGAGPPHRPRLGPPAPQPCWTNPADPGDAPVPGDLVAALVQVLAAWDWEQRPAGVVTLASRTRPQLIASLGERIAEIGRLPLLGSLTYDGPGPRASAQQFNSPQRLQAVWRELRLPGPLAEAVASLGGPVLVIDDRIETGWTMTLAARLLREAGAPRVLPLVLAVNAG